MRNISSLFINRPIGTSLLGALIILAGILAFKLLPVSQLPQIEFPTIVVQAALPGANPTIMASSVTTPLERQLGKISGVSEMTSTSGSGSSRIVLQFDLSRKIDGAANDVQAAINASLNQLPKELPAVPTYRKVNPADAPIMILSLTSDTLKKEQIYDAASSILQQKISQIEGVGQVNIGGSSLPSIRIDLNPHLLNHYGISLENVTQVINQAHSITPKGLFEDDLKSYQIETSPQIFSSHQYNPLIISYKNNSYVTLKDIAKVYDSVEDLKNMGYADGKPAVILIIFKEPGKNVIETVDRIQKEIPQLKSLIHKDIDLTVSLDRTLTIRASLFDVEKTLLISIILVILIVFLFFKDINATIIPCIAIPLSLLGTFIIMFLLGYSLDNLSLMALTIATGFVVDDAIVVLENINRHIELGKTPFQASLIGAKEVVFTIISISISLVAVFIPLLFMDGIVGRFFREFSITLSIAIIVSLFVSIIFTPTMCSKMLKNSRSQNYKINMLSKIYEKSLFWSINHKKTIILVTLLTIFTSVYLYKETPKGFFPQQDTGRIIGAIQTDQNISFINLQKKFTKFIDIIKQDEAIEHVVGYVGGSSANSGNVFISLKPLKDRKVSSDLVIKRLRQKLSTLPAAKIFLQSAQDIVIGGRQGGAQFQFSLSADNLTELKKWTQILTKELATLPGIADINNNQKENGLELFININNQKKSEFNISNNSINKYLYSYFGQKAVATIYKNLNQYRIIMEVDPKFADNTKIIDGVYINNSKNTLVPLNSFSQHHVTNSLLSINHQSSFPSTTLYFNLLPGISLGNIVNQINDSVKTLNLPPTVQASFQGSAKEFQKSLDNQPILILSAIVTVYIILGILYESFIHPITILSTLPSASVGALIALYITKTDLNLIALVGIILLIGIVKKNAIMMIDFAINVQKDNAISSSDAIFKSALLRFRPIMMTTLAAVLGAVPLAFGEGVGSEFRKPLGITIIGGLLFSQLLTLYTTPIIYIYFDKLSEWFKKNKPKVLGNNYEK
ncbi:efflux RND transporter permease subunit [Spirobacillus cienkowskii]|uniref:efflux RND transporter permease subunit n=1 Tax=Spirobacillus cienkowskii TaxID=495820 RepID=UPI0030CAA172